MRVRSLAAALAAGGLLCAAPASADTQTATSGTVAATLTYTLDEGGLSATDVRISVTRAGVLAYDAPVDPRACGEATCAPASTDADRPAVAATDLDGDGEPEVVVDVYTGGAHCCTISQILRWDGARYATLDRTWGDPSYAVDDVDGDGRPELVTADDRSAYLYGSYATSRFPVQVLSLQGGRLVDVTRSQPALLREDRAAHWRAARRRRVRSVAARSPSR